MKKSCRRLARGPAGNRSRIIFNSRAGSHLLKHFYIISCSGFKTLSFQHFTCSPQLFYPLFHFFLDSVGCTKELVMSCNEVLGWIENSFIKLTGNSTVHYIAALNMNNLTLRLRKGSAGEG